MTEINQILWAQCFGLILILFCLYVSFHQLKSNTEMWFDEKYDSFYIAFSKSFPNHTSDFFLIQRSCNGSLTTNRTAQTRVQILVHLILSHSCIKYFHLFFSPNYLFSVMNSELSLLHSSSISRLEARGRDSAAESTASDICHHISENG